jgi:thiosulfate dehydrogenase
MNQRKAPDDLPPETGRLLTAMTGLMVFSVLLLTGLAGLLYLAANDHITSFLSKSSPVEPVAADSPPSLWKAPLESSFPKGEKGDLIRYGKELIAHTAFYLGPEGSVAHISNGMNCQNCHLQAATKPFGNNYSAVAATYPKYRDRSSSIESIPL